MTNFLKLTQLISVPICHFRFSIFVLEFLKFKKKGMYYHWQYSQYLEWYPTSVIESNAQYILRVTLILHEFCPKTLEPE